MTKKEKRVKCAVCHKPIHKSQFGGVDKQGFYHKDCIVKKYTPKYMKPKKVKKEEGKICFHCKKLIKFSVGDEIKGGK